jgi:hypothetical protein
VKRGSTKIVDFSVVSYFCFLFFAYCCLLYFEFKKEEETGTRKTNVVQKCCAREKQ